MSKELLNLSLEEIKKLSESRKGERDRRRNRAQRIKNNNARDKIK